MAEPVFGKYHTYCDMVRQDGVVVRDVGALYGEVYQSLHDDLASDRWQETANPQAFPQVLANDLLIRAGRPYYKIYPDFVMPLAETTLAVPSEHFKLPFPAWEIRLPNRSLAVDGRYVQGILVADMRQTWQAQEWQPELVRKLYTDADMVIEHLAEEADVPRARCGTAVELHYQFHDPQTEKEAECEFHDFGVMDTSLTVEDSFLKLWKYQRPYQGKSAVHTFNTGSQRAKIWRLVLAMSFLVCGEDRLIEADVLRKDRDKLKKANAETAKKLQTRATRRRKDGIGHTVGRSERILRIAEERRKGMPTIDAEGRELSHSHMRSGHFHGYHTNEGYIVKWLPPLVVRPDLPPDPRGKVGVQIRSV